MSEKPGLEEKLKELEFMVKKLESGEIPLDQAIVDFEKSVKIYKECREYLNTAQKKISILNDELKETEFKA